MGGQAAQQRSPYQGGPQSFGSSGSTANLPGGIQDLANQSLGSDPNGGGTGGRDGGGFIGPQVPGQNPASGGKGRGAQTVPYSGSQNSFGGFGYAGPQQQRPMSSFNQMAYNSSLGRPNFYGGPQMQPRSPWFGGNPYGSSGGGFPGGYTPSPATTPATQFSGFTPSYGFGGNRGGYTNPYM